MNESKPIRKRSNSLSESTSSADESCNSVGDEISSSSLSGTSSPATSAHDYNSNSYDEPTNYTMKPFESHHISNLQAAHRQTPTEYADMMTRYMPLTNNYTHPLVFSPHLLYQQTAALLATTPPMDLMRAAYEPMTPPDYPVHYSHPELEQSKKMLPPASPPKKSGFSISAILGCES